MTAAMGGVLDGELDVSEDDLGVLDGELDVSEGDLGVLDGELDVSEGDLGVLDGDLSVLDGELDDSEDFITAVAIIAVAFGIVVLLFLIPIIIFSPMLVFIALDGKAMANEVIRILSMLYGAIQCSFLCLLATAYYDYGSKGLSSFLTFIVAVAVFMAQFVHSFSAPFVLWKWIRAVNGVYCRVQDDLAVDQANLA